MSVQGVKNQTISHLPNIEVENNLRRVNIAIVSFTKRRFMKCQQVHEKQMQEYEIKKLQKVQNARI